MAESSRGRHERSFRPIWNPGEWCTKTHEVHIRVRTLLYFTLCYLLLCLRTQLNFLTSYFNTPLLISFQPFFFCLFLSFKCNIFPFCSTILSNMISFFIFLLINTSEFIFMRFRGQKSRVAFACLTYGKPHVVILGN